MINIRASRPTVTVNADGDWRENPVIGTTAEWDWLFRELDSRPIASIKLIRQLNPGMCLKDAKDAYEALKSYRANLRPL